MKKLLLFSAVLIGAASASQAGGFNLRLGFPLPTPPRLVVSSPVPVVVAQRDCYEAQVAVAPPVCNTQVVVADDCRSAPVVVKDDCYRDRHVYREHRPFIKGSDWNRHHRQAWVSDDYRRCR